MKQAAHLQAYRNTLRTSVIVFAVGAISVPLDTNRYGWWPLGIGALVHAVQALVIGIWMWRRGSRWSVRTYDLLYVSLIAPYFVTIWYPQMFELAWGTLAEPLLAHHFLLLGVALLPPADVRLGLLMIGVVTAHGLALGAVLGDATTSPMLEREPWFTLLYGMIAAGILWSRWRGRERELQLTDAIARAHAMERVNRVLLALRDRANTPLQTLETALTLLEDTASQPTPPRVLAAMRRSLDQLTRVQQPLTEPPEHSPDLDIDLDRELGELRRRR